MNEEIRKRIIKKNITKITENARSEMQYEIDVKSFFEGNEYYLFIYEIYRET